MYRILLFILLMLSQIGVVFSSDTDSVYYVKASDFSQDVLHSKRYFYPVHTDSSEFLRCSYGVALLRTPQKFYLTLVNTGILFELIKSDDSIFTFRRIDKTTAKFYNISAYYFTVGENIFSIGGYGFWKNSGTLRKYNFNDAEWDVYPLSHEKVHQISPVNAIWYDPSDTAIYIPFQRIMNAGLKGGENSTGKIIPEASVLDLNTGNWEDLGSTTKAALDLYSGGFITFLQNFERGHLVIYKENLYWIDFVRNQIHVMQNSSLFQTLLRQIKHPVIAMDGNTMNFYSKDLNKVDSFKIDLSLFHPTGDAVWENDRSAYYFGIPLALACFLFLLFRFRKKRKALPVQKMESPSEPQPKPNLQLDDPELRLLQLLLERAKADMRCTIEEINYVLGLKDKNLGLQKKIRSDVINSLNQKYKFISGDEPALVLSIRSEQDKRYFEYYLDPGKLKEIEQLIERNQGASVSEKT